MLTPADLHKMTSDDRWEGFGYIGERRNTITAMGSGERYDEPSLISRADAMALEAANRQGMDYERLFTWANSKRGRWYGDCIFGSNGQHAEKYLPRR